MLNDSFVGWIPRAHEIARLDREAAGPGSTRIAKQRLPHDRLQGVTGSDICLELGNLQVTGSNHGTPSMPCSDVWK